MRHGPSPPPPPPIPAIAIIRTRAVPVRTRTVIHDRRRGDRVGRAIAGHDRLEIVAGSTPGGTARGARRTTRPVVSSAVAIAKPLLPWNVTAHQPSVQSPTSIRLPPGILVTIALVVFASARRLTVEAATPGLAIAAPVSSMKAQQDRYEPLHGGSVGSDPRTEQPNRGNFVAARKRPRRMPGPPRYRARG